MPAAALEPSPHYVAWSKKSRGGGKMLINTKRLGEIIGLSLGKKQ